MVDFEEPLLGILNAKVDDSFHDSFSKTSNQWFNRSSEDGAGRGTTGATGCPFLGSWIGKVQDLRVGSTRIGPFIHRAVGASTSALEFELAIDDNEKTFSYRLSAAASGVIIINGSGLSGIGR